jgi:hypothetical protein
MNGKAVFNFMVVMKSTANALPYNALLPIGVGRRRAFLLRHGNY